MYEELQFWKASDDNLFTGGGIFEGVGYIRDVMRARAKKDGSVLRDRRGNPVFIPTDERLH